MKSFEVKTLIIMVFAVCLLGCGKKDADKKDAETSERPSVTVAVPEVRTITLTANYPGNLEALKKVDIMARVDGVIKGVHAASGDKVKAGQLLYTIEDTKYRDAVRQARATLTTAESNHEYYSRQYTAMQKALAADAVSEITVMEAKNNLDQSQAQIENARAALADAELMLSYCRITAPFDGTLSLQEFDEGAYVSGETTPVKLNTIYNDDIVHAYISIDEAKYTQIVDNIENKTLDLDSVRVVFNEPLKHEYFSKINYQAPEVDPSTGTVTMRFNIDNRFGELKSGMYMNVEVPYEVAHDAILILDSSIGTDQQGKYVYTVDKSDRVVYTPIEVGSIYQDTLRVVTKGLPADSRYVRDALLKVKDGMQVKPIDNRK